MTSCSVGATGAGVPPPSATKRAKACTSTAMPAASTSMPMIRSAVQCGTRWPIRQPVIHHGISPATTPGATTKNAGCRGLRGLCP